LERIQLVLDAIGSAVDTTPKTQVYIAAVDASAADASMADMSTRFAAFVLAQRLRDAQIAVELDHQGRSLKSQFRQADKNAAEMVVVVGPDELVAGTVTLRVMSTHEEETVLIDNIVSAVGTRLTDASRTPEPLEPLEHHTSEIPG
jgi:histidyl-tRNA synthetase